MGTSGEIPRLCPYEDVGGPFFLDADGHTPDRLMDDMALWLRTTRGLVIVLGCCHSGVVNSLRWIRAFTGEEKIHGLIGGLHLLHASDERLEKTAAYLAECQPDFVYAGHCSGNGALDVFRAALPDTDVRQTQAGLILSWLAADSR